MNLLKSLTPIAWILIAVLLLAIVFGINQCTNARQAATEGRTVRSQAAAVQDSAADALDAVGGVSGRSGDTDRTTMENAHAIHSAPGADAPVDPGVRGAGLDSLCRRAAYRRDPQCVRFTPAGGMAGSRAGSTASGR